MAIRQILEAKGNARQYHVLCNIERALAKNVGDMKTIWFSNNPCPLNILQELYANVCYGFGARNASLENDVEKLWHMSLLEWLHNSEMFRVIDIKGDVGVCFAPKAEDVIIDCWDGDGKNASFAGIEPRLDWNRCDSCGKLNVYSLLKYDILSSATDDLVCKWCKYFNRNFSDYEGLTEHLMCKCRHCAYIDCPYAWNINTKDGGSKKEAGMVSFVLPTGILRRYARINDSYKEELAKSIEPEDWGEGFKCLLNYIDMNFYVQNVKGGLVEKNQFAWFNTGLLTHDNLEEVFMCFRGQIDGFEFDGITWKGNRNKKFDRYLTETGKIPNYIPMYNDIKDLYWDEKLDLVWTDNFDHIFFENQDRILNCRSFVNGTSGVAVPAVDDKQFCEGLKKLMGKGREADREAYKQNGYYKKVYELFAHSIKQVRKQMIRNYKWVLPFYYPLNRSMSIGIPVFLNPAGTGDVPDLVLVCNKRIRNGKEYYDVRTVLKNDQIYMDARQVCKPYCEWLSELLKLQSKSAPVEIRKTIRELSIPQNDDIGKRFEARFGCESRTDKLLGQVISLGKDFGWIRPTGQKSSIRFNMTDVKSGCAVKIGDKVHFSMKKREVFNAVDVVRYV